MPEASDLLLRFAVGYLVKQRDPVGLGPKPYLAGIGECGILDLEQLFAVVGNGEARGFEVDTQAMVLAATLTSVP
jgi:hypothetical protein